MMLTTLKERYINFFTDFGFKRLFGSESSKAVLLDFLNELLHQQEGKINSISYLQNEQVGRSDADRRAIYDIYCETECETKFIVEIQKTKQKFFKDRALYYSTFPIAEQAQKGIWNYQLQPVYVVAILDFVFDEDMNDEQKYRYDVKLSDIGTGKVFYDKLTFIYLEMPKFVKREEELSNRFEKWMYVIRNLSHLDKVPNPVREKIFEKFFKMAEISKLNTEEARLYEDSLKIYRDLNNSLDTAFDDGVEIGRAEGRAEGITEGRAEGRAEGEWAKAIETARKMLRSGFDIATISEITGLTEKEFKE